MDSIKIFIFYLLIFLLSYRASALESSNESKILDFLKDTEYTHILSLCHVFDFSGNKVAREFGVHCQINSDGSALVRSNLSVRRKNPDGTAKWILVFPRTHHQIINHPHSRNTLTIHNDFKMLNQKKVRFDVMVIINPDGKIIKTFSLKDLFLKHPHLFIVKEPVATYWFYKQIGVEKESFELTHTNSFIEIFKTNQNGDKILTGYLANCNIQKKLFFFNKDLTEVIKVVDLEGRSTHSLHQLNDNQIVFYQNSKSNQNKISSAELYDMKENKFTTLYSANDPYLSSSACGNIQIISKTKLMLGHSACINNDKLQDYGFALEFVDLEKKSAFTHILHKSFPYSSSYLINGTKYLQNVQKF